jgi:amino acid permease
MIMIVPDINDLASLVGAFVSPIMGFILPPMFHLALNRYTCSHHLSDPMLPSF